MSGPTVPEGPCRPSRLSRERVAAPIRDRTGRRKQIGASLSVVGVVLALAACGSSSTKAPTAANPLQLITPGTLTVSIEPYMPYVGEQNGKLTGLDGEIITQAAKNLGLKIKIVTSDFPGQLAAVQSHRVDVAIGSITWTAERAGVGLFTDPTYYSPEVMIEHKGSDYTNISQLVGKPVGTIVSYSEIPALQAIPGATLHTYPSAANMYSDITDGRIVAGFADALINIYVAQHEPQLDLVSHTLDPITAQQLAQHPAYKNVEPELEAFYIPKQEPALEKALNGQIDKFYKNGTEAKMLQQWGADPKIWLHAPSYAAAERIGVDRPKGWIAPSGS